MKYVKGNCLVAQSGGPTSVINSSAYGVIKKFLEISNGEKIYAGAYGIEGILQKKIFDITNIGKDVLNGFKYLPSAGLGSCRYKLKNFEESPEEYERLFKIFKEYNIKFFFLYRWK